MSMTPAGPRSVGFWLITVVATANYAVLSATAPLLNRAVTEELGHDAAVAGTLVSIAGFVGMVTMPVLGMLTGRLGPRAVTLAAAVVAAAGIAVAVAAFAVPAIVVSRILFGVGNAGITVATTAWVSATTPERDRGRALGYYGMSVWVGLAVGPLLAENGYAALGNRATWAALLALQAAALIVTATVRTGSLAPTPPRQMRATPGTSVARAVARPAAVAVAAWGAQGVLTTFLVTHLEDRGVGATGLTGGATVLMVFACAVLAARVALGTMADRLGPVTAARAALIAVAIGLLGLALAPSFWTACLAAVALGFGYAPLYPSLTLLATSGLDGPRRATAIGWFSAFTSAGVSIGALAGGALITEIGSTGTILLCAVAQLAVIPALAAVRRARATADA